MTPLFTKLNWKGQDPLVVLAAPESFEPELAALAGVAVVRDLATVERVTFALAFATRQAELDALSAGLTAKADGDAILWLAYPKSSSKRYRCDFNRDTGWTVLGAAGYEPVRIVAIDEDWTALRFRRTELIKNLTRSNQMAISAAGRARTQKS
jgi:hypothetical protein